MFYIVKPKEKFSRSRRWIADEDSLVHVEEHYRNYPKDPKNLIDRWNDFIVENVENVCFDFGGVLLTTAPYYKHNILGTNFEVSIMHYSFLITTLKNDNFYEEENDKFSFKTFLNRCYMFTNNSRELIYNEFIKNNENYEDEIDAFLNQFKKGLKDVQNSN